MWEHGVTGAVAEHHRCLGDIQYRMHDSVTDMGQVHHHPQSVHLVDHILSPFRQIPLDRSGITVYGTSIHPRLIARVRQRHVPDAQLVVHAKNGQSIVNRMATFDDNETCDLAVKEGVQYLCKRFKITVRCNKCRVRYSIRYPLCDMILVKNISHHQQLLHIADHLDTP